MAKIHFVHHLAQGHRAFSPSLLQRCVRLRERVHMRCPGERFSERKAGLLEGFHGCMNITPRTLGVKGLGVSNSLSEEMLLIPLTVSAVVVKAQLSELRFSRSQGAAGCLCTPIKGVFDLDPQVFDVCSGCSRGLLCLAFHTCDLRSDDTEM